MEDHTQENRQHNEDALTHFRKRAIFAAGATMAVGGFIALAGQPAIAIGVTGVALWRISAGMTGLGDTGGRWEALQDTIGRGFPALAYIGAGIGLLQAAAGGGLGMLGWSAMMMGAGLLVSNIMGMKDWEGLQEVVAERSPALLAQKVTHRFTDVVESGRALLFGRGRGE